MDDDFAELYGSAAVEEAKKQGESDARCARAPASLFFPHSAARR
jgi:hypothetical protein